MGHVPLHVAGMTQETSPVRQARGMFHCPMADSGERGSGGPCESVEPSDPCIRDFTCPKEETQASGLQRKPQELSWLHEPRVFLVLDLFPSSSPCQTLGCALSHGHHRGRLPGPPLPPGLHVCWLCAAALPQVVEGPV